MAERCLNRSDGKIRTPEVADTYIRIGIQPPEVSMASVPLRYQFHN